MASTLRVVLQSRDAWPDQRVTYRWDQDDWAEDHPCTYNPGDDRWFFDIDVARHPGPVEFKLRCEGVWQRLNGNLTVIPADVASRPEDLAIQPIDQVEFPLAVPVRDVPAPARRLCRPNWDAPGQWDVIVVGSGVGGGVLAHALAGRGKPGSDDRLRVLVLEAGGFLYPTHVGNLPRRLNAVKGIAHTLWQQWYDFRVQDGGYAPGTQLGRAINFGGRSIFWGALAPMMSAQELASWPPVLRADLDQQGRWYRGANDLLRVAPEPDGPAPADSTFAAEVIGILSDVLGGPPEPAPMAVEYRAEVPAGIPSGIFSTAALLTEELMQQADDDLAVHLNEPVVGLTLGGDADGGTVTSVTTRGATDGRGHRYELAPGGRVVLCAGTIGSPLLVLTSRLPGMPAAVGTGLTDHPIFHQAFRIPADRPFSPVTVDAGGEAHFRSSKTLTRLSFEDRTYNVVVELGANLNQLGVVARKELEAVRAGELGGTWCEIVFLVDTPTLVAGNTVTAADDGSPQVVMNRAGMPDSMRRHLEEMASKVIDALGGIPSEDGFQESDLGGVSHEVGTMRMAERPEDGVVDTNLRIQGLANAYICDLSVFPSSPASNPTLTLAALALRLADHLAPVP